MKTLVSYINESSIAKFKPGSEEWFDFEQFLIKYLRNQKNKYGEIYTYSVNNDIEMKRMFTFANRYGLKLLKKFNIKDGDMLGSFIWNNAKIIKRGFDVSLIRNFDESEMERKFKEFKKTSKYQVGQPFIKDEYNPEMDGSEGYRLLVIYDVNDPSNPDTTLCYKLLGKRGNKEIEHEVNMHKMDWKEQCDLTYYDARPIFAKNYIKKSDVDLKTIGIEFF